MDKYKYIILGAGPAGLAFANRLKNNNESDFILLEKEKEPGGLCRTDYIDDMPVDIGGGHFLDANNKIACDFLFDFMPAKEWNLYERDSRIELGENTIHHPLEANIWELPKAVQEEYLESVSKAKCNNNDENNVPTYFTDWIRWKLGDKIADEYMLPYNTKMFGVNLDQLGTYWLNKLPNVSYEEVLKSCKERRAYGKQPGHALFYYPKEYGYGELWLRMGNRLGDKLHLNQRVSEIDLDNRVIKTSDGCEYQGDYIINTVPWTSLAKIDGLTCDLQDSISKLLHTSIVVELFNENLESPCHWLYVPNMEKSYHRILLRNNFSQKGIGYWTETNLDRFDKKNPYSEAIYINEYAYPLNTIEKPNVMDDLLKYVEKKNVYGLGRWGEHQHYNSDVTVIKAIELADRLINKK